MSFSHLATVGTLSYNGYTFDGSASVTVSVECVQDEAQRTVLYNKHTISVRFFVNDSSDLDGDVLALRARLTKQGQALRFTGHGFGDDLIVNVGALRDVKWGPVPRIIQWTPVGGTNTCEVVWEVETCVPVCSTSPNHRTTGVMAMNYEVAFDIEKGFTTRTITGYLEIAQTRLFGAVPDTADRYRHLINPVVPIGFERQSSWRLSLDKSRLDFTIVDRQLRTRNAYPVGVVRIDGGHRVAWSRGRDAMKLRNSIGLDIELAADAAPALAWNIFGTIVRQQTDLALRNGLVPLLDEVTAEEELFGMGHSFTASWRLLVDVQTALSGAAAVNNIFNFSRTGLWQPLNTDWRLWRTSMRYAFDNRGYAGLTQLAANDAIVDLCSQNATVPWNGQNPPITTPRSGQQPTFTNRRPPPQKSYLKYVMQVVPGSQRPAVRQATLQPADQQSPNAIMQGTSPAVIGSPGQSTSDVIQLGGISRHVVSLVGQAMRAGYEIPRPALTQVGSLVPVETAASFLCEAVDNWFGVPIFRAAWQIDYLLPNAPGAVRPLPNLEN